MIRTVITELRETMPSELPSPIKEVILGNVVVGNFTPEVAMLIAGAIAKKLKGESDA
jgi:hypothetical protein